MSQVWNSDKGSEFGVCQASCLALLAWACKRGNCHEESAVLQLQPRRESPCLYGEEEYTFDDWASKLYARGESPVSGITITDYITTEPICQQPAILSDANSGGGSSTILACNCSALIFAEDGSSNSLVEACNAALAGPAQIQIQSRPEIELTFDQPQDIVEVTFYNVDWDFNEFQYTTTGDETWSVFMPVEGRFNPSVFDLTQEEIKAESVSKIQVRFRGRAAFTSMKLCKGAGSLVGDPHVRTQDHAHYTVLNEGNFLAWRFNSDAAVVGKSGHKEVDWSIYVHYSAHRRSWTRGLLLVDESMGSRHHSLEFTSEECKLRQRVGDEWRVMESSEMLEVSDGGHFVTGFNFTHLENGSIHFESKKIWTPKGNKARWDAEFLMATPRGKQRIASLQLRCFPGRHIDMQVIRERMGDARFVSGQLGHHGIQLKKEKNGLGHWFHTSSDHEFQLNASWRELGGSPEAAAFFDIEDNKATTLIGNPTCTSEEKEEAMRLCKETMKMSRNVDAEILDECVLDICAGGGVAAAELAADIFSS